VRWIGAVALLVGCTTSSGVELTRSDQHPVPTATSTEPASTEPDSTAPAPESASPVSVPDVDPVAWHECAAQPAPWQCGEIAVPLDYRQPAAKQIFISLDRLPAAQPAERIGSLVLNPGGPGGSGIELADAEAERFPPAIRNRFDVVGFDPRGVGASTAARCPDDFDVGADSYDRCIDESRDLLPFIGTVNVARDLEEIRIALGDSRLTYLGYSYGTAIGAVYADMFPDHVRALVLDGAVDPAAGHVNSTGAFGDDYYAQQDFEGTVDVFHTMCDASVRCAAGPHSKQLLGHVEDVIDDLPVSNFAGATPLTSSDVDDIVTNSMYNVGIWPALAIALHDADGGDASTLAALDSWLQYGYPADKGRDDDFGFAHLAIECADFAGRGVRSFDCQGFPDTADPLPDVVRTTSTVPIVVVGTADDPATPARYAPKMATALGNAVAIEWEGAGHTAFLTSKCVTKAVTDYIVRLAVPATGLTCPFVVGADTVAQRADALFAPPRSTDDVLAITDVLTGQGMADDDAQCVAAHLVNRGDRRLIVHETLGVESPDLVAVRRVIERECAIGG